MRSAAKTRLLMTLLLFLCLKMAIDVDVPPSSAAFHTKTGRRRGGGNAVVMRKSLFKAPARSSGRRGEKPYFRFSPPAGIA